ncbi:PREDICTED: uncharacterized protein LOC105556919 [Vollenhovia emeryi]|uniref:uncharacterized protein LOC105556919 n=1 Tax=Vollenhovia emeryi TaxID=411798 RepID=UPI0005F3DD13|nr:PREDICTED: uncharacterized protein LOC105556919 [Vollenhovia emeryi]
MSTTNTQRLPRNSPIVNHQARLTMDQIAREKLDEKSLKDLQKEAVEYGLTPCSTREGCIDQISTHLLNHGPLVELMTGGAAGEDDSNPPGFSAPPAYTDSGITASARISDRQTQAPTPDAAFSQIRQFMAQEMLKFQESQAAQQQEMLNKMLSAFNLDAMNDRRPASPTVQPVVHNSRVSPQPTESFSTSSTNAARFLAAQIPQFGRSEEENVELRVEKIESIAEAHILPPVARLSAATIKLTKAARRWFDLSPGSINKSWDDFKTAIIRRFKRRILFSAVMKKSDDRKWQFSKETFQDYAMEKISILQCLRLPEDSIIHCLIDGINIIAIKAIAASIQTDSIDEFLEQMHHITTTCGTSAKKSPVFNPKIDKTKPKQEGSSKTDLHTKNPAESFCVYCRSKGHTRDDCFKLKKKEQSTNPGKPAATKPAPLISTVTEVTEVPSQAETVLTDLQTVALVEGPRKRIAFSSPVVKVTKLNDSSIRLHVLDDQSTSTDMIIGLDFLNKHNLEVLIKPASENPIKNPKNSSTETNDTNKLDLLAEVASVEVAEKPYDTLDSALENISVDFDLSTKKHLIETIKEVDSASIPVIDDDHSVKINLKEDSVFAFAPRRFAWSERLQIREIVNDLLEKKIIKESNSPYCSRIVPVRKKDGSLRLCVDLRPLNGKVNKQKYPFPIIEDCLARLGNKSVFTLLDLKDGFYQLKVHPEFTKFFAFATPDGQYEYLRLPFGFCEAPAEFQRRLLFILRSLIKEDKILVYLDDILIPSSSVQENLQILKQVLISLKSYGLSLNLGKCKFLRTTVEYLGYIISSQGITLSPRHVEAIQKFPQPRKTIHLQKFLGLTNYFRKFIENYATIARPLHNLLKKDSPFRFNDTCVNSFNTLKERLISFPILRLYSPNLPTELHTDASTQAIAAILMQKQKEGQWLPVSFFSQATNQAKAKYHSFELEMLAVVSD